MLAIAKDYIRQRYKKPGNVYLGVVSRLDTPVSGVVVFARTSKSARRLSEQFRERNVAKIYWAIVEGKIQPPVARCVEWIRYDEEQRRSILVPDSAADAQYAALDYKLLCHCKRGSLLEVQLETGRKHQIRAQFAGRGHPILGDRRYGARLQFAMGIALHARSLEITHPVQNRKMTFSCPVPSSWHLEGLAENYLG